MEHGQSPENPEPSSLELVIDPEIAIEDLPAALGFTETEEMAQLRARLLSHGESVDADAANALIDDYHRLGQETLISKQSMDYKWTNIGLILAVADLRQKLGYIDDYLEGLDWAAKYATYLGSEAIVAIIDEAAAEIIGGIEENPQA